MRGVPVPHKFLCVAAHSRGKTSLKAGLRSHTWEYLVLGDTPGTPYALTDRGASALQGKCKTSTGSWHRIHCLPGRLRPQAREFRGTRMDPHGHHCFFYKSRMPEAQQ